MKFNHILEVLIAAFFLALLFFISSLVYDYHVDSQQKSLLNPTSENGSVLSLELEEVAPPEQTYNVLLLGHGDPGHPGGDLADSLILVHLNSGGRRVALISIPRDTWLSVRLNEDQIEPHKINEVFSVGRDFRDEEYGFQLIKQAVSEVTGLPVHRYIFVSFGKFMEVIDTLGGVEVEVPVSFDEYFYPVRGRELETCGKSSEEVAELSETLSGFELEKQFPCRYEHLHFEAGKTKMNGEDALKFVRSRHSEQHGGDFARSERQQAVIVALKDKLLSLGALEDAPELFGQLEGLVRTDLDLEIVNELVPLIVDPQSYEITRLVLSDKNVFTSSINQEGQYILVPVAGEDQWQDIHALIQDLLSS